MMKEFARSALKCSGSYYYRLRATKVVWQHLLNREGSCRYREHPVELSRAETVLLTSLREQGIAIAHVSEFFPSHVFDELVRYVKSRWQSPDVGQVLQERLAAYRLGKPDVKKAFLVNLWPGEPVLDFDHPFIRFALSEPILATVNAYLGMFSKFRAWRLEATIPMPRSVRPSSSQRWHRDEEDRKLVKVFLYLNDVDASAGPFTYLKHSHTTGKWRNLFPMVPPRGSLRMPPNEDEYIPKSDVIAATGKAGTMIFCDTTGLHKGGLATEKNRFMCTLVYTSSASPWPIRYRYPTEFRPENLSPAVSFAVRNNPRQREPRFYR
jgi:hypothetical protein